MPGTILEFQAKENVREGGRVLVASGTQSRNRDYWTGLPYRLIPGGMRLEHWQKNPLIFYMHNLGIPLAKAEMFLEDGKLWAWDEFEFHRKEVPVFNTIGGFGMFNTAAIADLWEEGFLNAVSIHIILTKQDEENVIAGEEEIIIPSSEVIEASVVTVPGDRESVREQDEEKEFLQEFAERLMSKGVKQEMAECVACSFGQNLWTPPLPVWAENSGQSFTSDRTATTKGSQFYSVPEVSMSKKTVEQTKPEETALAVEETPVEPTETAVEGTPEMAVVEDLVIEQEIELPVADIAQAFIMDAEAMRIIAQALFSMPEFAEHVLSVSAPQQALEPVVQEVLPQRISVRLTTNSQRQPAQVEQPARPVERPVAFQQAVAPQPVAPVATPAEQLNGKSRRRLSALDLLPPRSG